MLSLMGHFVSHKTVAVLGASGATGRHAVNHALLKGHHVVALVRRPGLFDSSAALHEVVWGDVTDNATLSRAFIGVDVVISALGGANKGPTSVCADAMRAVLPAMNHAGVNRLIAVSAHGILETRGRSLYALAAWAGVGERLKDKEKMEPLIVASDLDWTIVRPPKLTDSPATGTYQTGEHLPIKLWHTIGRADLAAFLIRESENGDFHRGYPRIRQ